MSGKAPTAHRRDSWTGAFLRRWGLVGYWSLFAVGALWAARSPGFVPTPDVGQYPWLGVFKTWGLLAIEAAVLYAILRPCSFGISWSRLWLALLLESFLLGWRVLTISTDMPGYYYVPSLFSAIAFVGLWAVALAMRSQSRRRSLLPVEDGTCGPTRG